MNHQSVVKENGLETWRVLRNRDDSKTTLRIMQIWLKIMNPGKMKQTSEFLDQVKCWETAGSMSRRRARVGQLIMMAPDELQNTVLEHADRLQNYAQVKENMVMLPIRGGESPPRHGRGIHWRR